MNDRPTKPLADFIVRTKFKDLPPEVVHEVKRILLDTAGCALAGTAVEKGKIGIEVARSQGGNPEATILGVGDMTSCTSAAFANGELMSAMDFDTILPPGHVSCFVIPAALAVAERECSSGKELLPAIALAHEITARIGGSLPSFRSGKDTTKPPRFGHGACIFGAVTAAGKLMGFDRADMANAFGTAGALTPIPIGTKWQQSPYSTMFKYGAAGWTASGGVMGALLAEHGYIGDDAFLDGPHGFWHMYGADSCNWDKMLGGLGEDWFLRRVAYKPYASAGFVNPMLDAFREVMMKHNLKPEEIEKVTVKGERMGLLPVYRVKKFRSHMDAQFNPPYGIAMVAFNIKPTDSQDETVWRDPKIREFAKKVKFEEYPRFEESRRQEIEVEKQPYVIRRPAFAEVVARGKVFSAAVEYPRWGPSTVAKIRVSDEELKDKFRQNCAKMLPARKVERAIELIFSLEKVDDIDELIDNLCI